MSRPFHRPFHRARNATCGAARQLSGAARATVESLETRRLLAFALTATPTSGYAVELGWVAPGGASQLTIQRREPFGNFTNIATVAASAGSFVDTGVQPGTSHQYLALVTADPAQTSVVVKTTSLRYGDASGDGQIDSQDDDAFLFGGTGWAQGDFDNNGVVDNVDYEYLSKAQGAPVIGTIVSSSSAHDTIHLAWSDQLSEVSYRIERTLDPAGIDWELVGTVEEDSTGFDDVGLSPQATYYYRVKAVGVDGPGFSPYSTVISGSTLRQLTATSPSGYAVQLDWGASLGADSLIVERRGANQTSAVIATLGAGATSYLDTSVQPGTDYEYVIYTTAVSPAPFAGTTIVSTLRLGDATGDGLVDVDDLSVVTDGMSFGLTGWANGDFDNSGGVTSADLAQLNQVISSPAPPDNLTASAVSSNQITLNWGDVSGETGYIVQRTADALGIDWVTIATPPAGANSYADTTVADGRTYHYRAKAVGAFGAEYSVYGASATAVTPLAAVTDLYASGGFLGIAVVALSWTDASVSETKYVVQRWNGSAFATVAQVMAGSPTEYIDANMPPSAMISYRVLTSSNGVEVASNIVTIPMPTAAQTLTSNLALVAAVNAPGTAITLSWPNAPAATRFSVSRRLPGEANWNLLTSTPLPASAQEFVDVNVSAGQAYEYQVVKEGAANATGVTRVGVRLVSVTDRGGIVLVIDNAYQDSLSAGLARLQQDLVGDGWTVYPVTVNPTDSPTSVRQLIQNRYATSGGTVSAAMLFGHVPIPHSGLVNPDGHGSRAYSTDTYYADMDGVWTDATANGGDTFVDPGRATVSFSNHPGDGKFDQNTVPDDTDGNPLELAVGRVDFFDMSDLYVGVDAATATTQLLQTYLDKDHLFRHGLFNVPQRGIIDSGFDQAATRAFYAMFGEQGITRANWNPTLTLDAYLWAHAGRPSSITTIGVDKQPYSFWSMDVPSHPFKAVFTSMFGSYFGDFDAPNDVMRAVLGSQDPTLPGSFKGAYGLTATYDGGEGAWYPMALGETVGSARRLSSNQPTNALLKGSITRNLMGDPTLRLTTPLSPVIAKVESDGAAHPVIRWTAAADAPAQTGADSYYYDVYRSSTATGPFTKLNTAPVTATSYTDATAGAGTWIYMVRAVRLEITPASGSYFNPSQGVFAVAKVGTSSVDAMNVRYDGTSDSVQFFNNAGGSGSPILSVARAGLESIGFAGAGGDDTLVIDLLGTGASSAQAINVNADTGVGENDLVRISGSSGNDTLVLGAAVSSIGPVAMTFAGVEGIDFDGRAGSDQVSVTGGSFRQVGDLRDGTNSVTVAVTGGAIEFGATQHLSSINVSAGLAKLVAGGDKVIFTGAVSMSGTGRLDLVDNDMIVRGGTLGSWNGAAYTGITGYVASGAAGGYGIMTSVAGAGGYITGVGVSTGASALGGVGSFDGESVLGSDIVLRYTYSGDANLDGVLDVDDYLRIDLSILLSNDSGGYDNGDFDLNGVTDIDDYGPIDFNFPIQTGSS